MSISARLKVILMLFLPLMVGLAGVAWAEEPVERDFEDRVMQVLADQMNLKSDRRPLGEGSGDEAVATIIQGEPNIALLANARIVGKDQEGKVSQLSFSLTLIPDRNIKASPAKFLEWANQQNSQQVPAKVFLEYPRFGVMSSRLIDVKHPMADEEIVAMYVYMMQSWRAMQQNLEDNQLI